MISFKQIRTERDVALLMPMVQRLAESEGATVKSDVPTLTACLVGQGAISTALLAFNSDEAVGYAIFSPKLSTFSGIYQTYLDHLYVVPEERRSGVASGLLRAVAKAALDSGSTQLELRVQSSNKAALAFYQKNNGELIDNASLIRLSQDVLVDLGSSSKG